MTINEFEVVGNQIQNVAKAKGLRIGIVRSLFRSSLTEQMEAVVQKRAASLGAKIVTVALSRGALETPLVAQRLLQQKNVDGVVILAAVIQGKTHHDDVVVTSATHALVDVSLRLGKPVGIGIIGPGVTLEQAHERVVEYAQGALDAVVLSATHTTGKTK